MVTPPSRFCHCHSSFGGNKLLASSTFKWQCLVEICPHLVLIETFWLLLDCRSWFSKACQNTRSIYNLWHCLFTIFFLLLFRLRKGVRVKIILKIGPLITTQPNVSVNPTLFERWLLQHQMVLMEPRRCSVLCLTLIRCLPARPCSRGETKPG